VKTALADRGVQAALVLVAVAATGFAAVGLGWRGVANQRLLVVQLPYVVSGAIGGVALAGAALGLLAVHLERRQGATDRLVLDDAIRSARDLAEAMPAFLARRRPATTTPILFVNGRTVHLPDCRFALGRNLAPLMPSEPTDRLRACRICRPPLGE